MKQEELNRILNEHKKWLNGEGGARAELSGADLMSANLRSANLRSADLRSANLRSADLRSADLRSAELSGAYLSGANLSGANLSGADLRSANLRSADLSNISANENTAMYWSVCPESGSFIAYKKANNGRQHLIVKLLVPEDAKRSSATTRKCRCDRAEVLEIRDIAGIECFDKAISSHDPTFIYEVGKTVSVDNFDEDRWNECSYGIHFFITREEAVRY